MSAYEKYIARLFCVIGFVCGVLITIGLVPGVLALLK